MSSTSVVNYQPFIHMFNSLVQEVRNLNSTSKFKDYLIDENKSYCQKDISSFTSENFSIDTTNLKTTININNVFMSPPSGDKSIEKIEKDLLIINDNDLNIEMSLNNDVNDVTFNNVHQKQVLKDTDFLTVESYPKFCLDVFVKETTLPVISCFFVESLYWKTNVYKNTDAVIIDLTVSYMYWSQHAKDKLKNKLSNMIDDEKFNELLKKINEFKIDDDDVCFQFDICNNHNIALIKYKITKDNELFDFDDLKKKIKDFTENNKHTLHYVCYEYTRSIFYMPEIHGNIIFDDTININSYKFTIYWSKIIHFMSVSFKRTVITELRGRRPRPEIVEAVRYYIFVALQTIEALRNNIYLFFKIKFYIESNDKTKFLKNLKGSCIKEGDNHYEILKNSNVDLANILNLFKNYILLVKDYETEKIHIVCYPDYIELFLDTSMGLSDVYIPVRKNFIHDSFYMIPMRIYDDNNNLPIDKEPNKKLTLEHHALIELEKMYNKMYNSVSYNVISSIVKNMKIHNHYNNHLKNTDMISDILKNLITNTFSNTNTLITFDMLMNSLKKDKNPIFLAHIRTLLELICKITVHDQSYECIPHSTFVYILKNYSQIQSYIDSAINDINNRYKKNVVERTKNDSVLKSGGTIFIGGNVDCENNVDTYKSSVDKLNNSYTYKKAIKNLESMNNKLSIIKIYIQFNENYNTKNDDKMKIQRTERLKKINSKVERLMIYVLEELSKNNDFCDDNCSDMVKKSLQNVDDLMNEAEIIMSPLLVLNPFIKGKKPIDNDERKKYNNKRKREDVLHEIQQILVNQYLNKIKMKLITVLKDLINKQIVSINGLIDKQKISIIGLIDKQKK